MEDAGAAGPWYGNYDDVAAAEVPGYRRKPIFENGYFRAEYLNWTISRPGDVLLGSPVLGNPDPSQPFIVNDLGGSPLGTATVPTTIPFALNNQNGFRATIGADFIYGGLFELSAFVLAPAKSSFSYDPNQLMFNTAGGGNSLSPIPTTQFIGTSTFVNGQLANNVQLYNYSYKADYYAQLWGAEANYLFESNNPGGILQIRPLVGFRYVSLNNQMTQNGVFRDTTFATPVDTNTNINSVTYNNLYGPQVGLKTELVSKWVTLGFMPKIGLAGNTMLASVSTDQFRSPFDPPTYHEQKFTGVSPMIDLSTYLTIHATDRLSFRIGYNFLFLGRVTLPEDNIYYNDRGPYLPPVSFIPPDVTVSATRHDYRIYGLTCGGELKF